MREHDELHSTPLGVVYETPGQDAISLWRVYGSNGQGTSSILQGRIRPEVVVGGTVYAVKTDALGVDRLVVYRNNRYAG